MKGRALTAYVFAVLGAGLAVLAVLLLAPVPRHPWTLLLLAGLAALAGARPVRIPAKRTWIAAIHPFVFCALAAYGALPAVLVGAAGALGSAANRSRRPTAQRLAFNFGALILSAVLAAAAFRIAGGAAGAGIADLLGPMTAAATAYFVGNTSLVAVAIALEQKEALLSTWRSSLQWTAVSFFAGLTLAVGLLLALELWGPWSVALAIPPCWLLAAFHRSYKERLDERQRRIDEVETLNVELEQTVVQLRQALARVKQLQGLLPICMHCSRIRDDKNAWHKLESYIATHSEVTFTHSLCDDCRTEHYPDHALRRRSPAR
jgi:hypothetical protein